jgi:hypothetical protein
MSEQTPLEFEREKWRDEYELRKHEIVLKERDTSRSRWSSPLVLAVLAAAVAAGGNALVTWLNGQQARDLEETKAEAARILEVIKTNDTEKAAANLKFLVDAGLISDANRRRNVENFLAHRPAGQGPALPFPGVSLQQEKIVQQQKMSPAVSAEVLRLLRVYPDPDAIERLRLLLPEDTFRQLLPGEIQPQSHGAPPR